MQGQKTVPRESDPEDNEKSIHLEWGTGQTAWSKTAPQSCEEGIRVEEQSGEEAEL